MGTNELLRLELGYSANANNGNIASQRMTFPAIDSAAALDVTQTYQYDPLNRLSQITEGGQFRQFGYDRFGNMWVSNASSGFAGDSFTPATSNWFDANNRLTNDGLSIQHDAAGNLTAIGGFEYAYDAEGMLTEATPSIGSATTYRYDGEGRRAQKQTGTGAVTTFVYSAFGELAAEYTSDGVPEGQPTGTHYLMADHLGSTRLVMDASGDVVSRHDYLPFGEEINANVSGRTTAMKYVVNEDLTQRFTSKERDAETGLDYFGARYFSGAQGRMTSSDEPFADQDPADPQSWNLYAYARNNPLLFVDPTGHYTCHSSVSAQECTNFQDSLTEAQRAANALKQKYGANSTQYTDAQRAIDSYGAAGVDNGVVIKIGNTGSAGAQVQVGGVAGTKTKDNPTGQQIDVTFGTGQLGKGGAANAGLSAHEGSHVADGSAWVASGFKDALNPTRYATESRAYRISASIYEGQGYLYGTFSPTELMWFRGWPQSNVDARIDYWLRMPKAQGGLYGVTSLDKTKAFTPGARLRR